MTQEGYWLVTLWNGIVFQDALAWSWCATLFPLIRHGGLDLVGSLYDCCESYWWM